MDVDVKDRHVSERSDEEELSEDQIEQLLRQAEDRLLQEQSLTRTTTTNGYLPRNAKLDISALPKPYVQTNGDVARADSRRLIDDNQRQLANGIRRVEDPLAIKRKTLEEKKATAGAEWYNLPRTNMTPELKRDLQLLKMRSVLDPKRFYKKESSKAKGPEFSQVGTLVEGPTDFFSGRLSNRERKRTLVEEVLAGERDSGRFSKKYLEIQAAKTSGKKGHYKAMMAKKYGNKFKR